MTSRHCCVFSRRRDLALDPSIAVALASLGDGGHGALTKAILIEHHRVRPAKHSHPIVEAFRRADRTDGYRIRRRHIVLATAASLAAVSCGQSQSTVSDTTPEPVTVEPAEQTVSAPAEDASGLSEPQPPAETPPKPEVEPAGPAALPSIAMTDVGAGSPFNIDQLSGGQGDILPWFYLPPSGRCIAQSSDVEQFAQQNSSVQVIGVGIQNTLERAEALGQAGSVDKMRLLWSQDFDAWSHYGVQSRHMTVLLDSAGNEKNRWTDFKPGEISSALSS